METIFIILILIALIFGSWWVWKTFKFPKVGSIAVFTGGVKVGKSAVSLCCAISNYKRSLRQYYIKKFLCKFLNLFKRKNKFNMPEKPFLYSNIPLRHISYIQLKTEHLLRKIRLRRGSVVFIDEASLVADSQLISDRRVNLELLLFFKLFGHECAGTCVVNTHSITDLHYALKRCTSQYFYIHHLSKFIPFLKVAYMREERYADDGTSTNVYNEDLEDTLKQVMFWKSTFKRYDSYCYSYLTDYLPYDSEKNLIKNGKYDSLKANSIVSFRKDLRRLKTREEIECENEQ